MTIHAQSLPQKPCFYHKNIHFLFITSVGSTTAPASITQW